MNKLAQALGWSDETLEVVKNAEAAEKERRYIAYGALKPHLDVAHDSYLREGRRLIAYLRERGCRIK